jgi:hypothetical protein
MPMALASYPTGISECRVCFFSERLASLVAFMGFVDQRIASQPQLSTSQDEPEVHALALCE